MAPLFESRLVAAVDNASDGGEGRQTQNDETTPQGRLTTYQIPEVDEEEEEDAPSSLDNEGDEDHAQERRAEQKEHRRLSLQQAQEEDSEEPQQQGGWNPFSA